MIIEHIAINVKDPKAMVDWYCKHLGMKVVFKTEVAYFLGDNEGKTVFELYNNPPEEVPDYGSMNPLILHLAFWSEDIMGDYKRVVKAGAKPAGPEPTEEDKFGVFMLRDPWGLAFQLVRREKAF